MSWIIVSVRAPPYIINHSHNSPFRRSEELEFFDDNLDVNNQGDAVDNQSDDGTPAPEPLPPDVTLCITTDHFPKDPGVGFVFGRDSDQCDVLLPSDSRHISRRQFSITFNTSTGAVILRNLSQRNCTRIRVQGEFLPIQLREQRSFAQETVLVRFHGLDIEITRPWDDYDIGSPHYNFFLAKLTQVVPNMGAMRLASTLVPSAQTSSSRNQGVYRLGPIIGQGVSSTVYLGSHRETGDVVAIKRYVDRSSATSAACKEIGILSTLKHNHIVTIYQFNLCIGQPTELIMEYAPLGSMAHQSRDRSFSHVEGLAIFDQILQALHYLHSKRITHRDVKPDNVLIITRDPIHAKLADFGVSSVAKQHTTLCGTAVYAAPEVYRPPYTAKVDIWSVGVMALQLWIGLPPHSHKSTERDEWVKQLLAHRSAQEKPLLKEFLDACLQLQPTKRLSAEQCLGLGFFRSRTGTLPKETCSINKINSMGNTSTIKAVGSLPDTAPCHAVEGSLPNTAPCHAAVDSLPDTAPCRAVEDSLPDTGPCHAEEAESRCSPKDQAEMPTVAAAGECGIDDQGLDLSQQQAGFSWLEEAWSSISSLGPWPFSPIGLANPAVDEQRIEGTLNLGVLPSKDERRNADTNIGNGSPQPPALQDYVDGKGRVYQFFRWHGRTIAHTSTMVNLTQMLVAAQRGKPDKPEIQEIIRHNKLIVCRRLKIDMTGLPDFIVSLDRDMGRDR